MRKVLAGSGPIMSGIVPTVTSILVSGRLPPEPKTGGCTLSTAPVKMTACRGGVMRRCAP